MTEIKNMDQFKKFLAENKTVIIDFHAEWCGPCKMIAPKLKEFGGKYPEVIVGKVDVDEADDVSESEGVSAMPTFHIYQDGKKVDELVGASIEKLEALFVKYN